MNNLEQESENRKRATAESRDIGVEARQEKEKEMEKKLGARERVEKVSYEVKSAKKQMQNIIVNMQQVVKAVHAIRVQLGLATGGSQTIPSVEKDKKTLEDLKKKLAKLNGQLSDLRVALVQEEIEEVRKEHSDWNEEQIQVEAEKLADAMIQELGLDGEV
ncbi:hypothetical protein KKA13_00420 [Patescibacteria group bacterium]|nr:hypothetical protein [Patescibacteria group bacterium]MBU1613361.1 hypothetical protein [Patescibacteria group bacterium]